MSKLETKNKAIPVVTVQGITANKDFFSGFFNSENIINKGDFIYLGVCRPHDGQRPFL